MAHSYEASRSHGSRDDDGYTRPTNLNSEEAQILANNILIPPAWHLPHGWHVSVGWYAVAPIPPEGSLLDDYIEQRCRRRNATSTSGR
jgi:hypothetical protein